MGKLLETRLPIAVSEVDPGIYNRMVRILEINLGRFDTTATPEYNDTELMPLQVPHELKRLPGVLLEMWQKIGVQYPYGKQSKNQANRKAQGKNVHLGSSASHDTEGNIHDKHGGDSR